MPDRNTSNKPGLTKEEQLEAKVLLRPWLFAEAFLQDPVNPNRPLRLRSYQRDILKDRHYRRILRCGRRIGKSIILAIEAIYKGFTYANRRVLIVTAYEGQLDEIFNAIEHLAFDSDKIRDSIERVTQKPHKVWFRNGSTISGNVGNNSVRGKCLPAGTQVWTASLTWKPIEEVQPGDKIISYNLEEERFEAKKVKAVHDNGDRPIYEVSTTASRFLRATEGHKVFSANGEYIEIKNLKSWKTHQSKADFIASSGIDVSLNPLDGSREHRLQLQFGRVYNVKNLGIKEKTFDLTVEDNHNFVAMYPPGEEFSPFKINGATNGGLLVHNSADDLIIDECDYIPENILLEAIWPIATTTKDTSVILSSTPTGRHEFFHNVSRNQKNPAFNFHEFHIMSNRSPEWTPEHETLIRATTDPTRYSREYEARFGAASEGVFQHKYVEASLFVYDYDQIQPNSNSYITMGVDWNEAAAGVRIMLLEHVRTPTSLHPYNEGQPESASPVIRNNFLRCLKSFRISSEDYTNTAAVDFILRLFKKYPINYSCFDKGHGHTNWEILRLAMQRGVSPTGYRCGTMTHMLDRMEVIDFGGTSEVIDVTTNKTTKVRTKNLIVRDGVKLLENDLYVIPAISPHGHTVELESNRLIGQMRDYSVIRTTDKGEVYSRGNDHTLDAWLLASHAFLVNHDEFITWNFATNVAVAGDQGLVVPYAIAKRGLTPERGSPSPNISTRDGMTVRDWGLYPKQGDPPEDDDRVVIGPSKNRRRDSRSPNHSPRKTDI